MKKLGELRPFRLHRLYKFARVGLYLLLIAAILFGSYRWIFSKDDIVYASKISVSQLLSYKDAADELPYAKVMLNHPEVPSEAAKVPVIEIPPLSYEQSAPETKLEKGNNGAELNWNNDLGWVQWAFNAPQTGWYELHLEYKPLPGGNTSVVRGVQIDGKYPFLESEHLELERHWKDAKYPYDRNEIGMQVRPQQIELVEWTDKPLSDYAASSRPLLYRLEQGKHMLRLVGERNSVAFRAISFQPQKPIADYESYAAAQPAAKADGNWYAVTEAEQFQRKSSLAIQTDHWSEPYVSPDPKGKITYNVLGGQRWRRPGEWVEWQLSVPENGWYEIDLKNFQNYRNGFKAYRTIAIDGQTPFKELLHYSFDFHKEFVIQTLADSQGKPFRFYLTKGAHTVRMISDSSELAPILLALKETLKQLAEFDRHIRLITGNYSKSSYDANTDSVRTWDMNKYDPGIAAKIQGFSKQLADIRDYMNGLNGMDSDLSQGIKSSIDILDKMLIDVNEIPNKMTDFSKIQGNIGTWMTSLTQEPLLFDYLVVRTPGAKTGLKEPTLLSRIPYSLKDFGRSFYMDYDLSSSSKKGALTIWVQRGRDYVNLLREIVDEDFTPKTGIQVNIELMPNPNMLILGNAAGNVPDLALGVGEATPVDYAMRDAVEDLSKYPGFADVNKQFIPGVQRALTYNGGTYGLPEVENFQVLFYRTDIFENLHLKVPDTWNDVFDILPTLQENGMTIHYPKSDFSTIFFENGAEPYSANGLQANLTSAAGQTAFQKWTDLFKKYNLPIDIPSFYQHFRDGDIPIGVADFNTYVQLLVAAPEITGHWKIAPLPGIKQPNGEVARWSQQGVSSAMMMKKSKMKDEAWEFLKWWTSADVQERYANDIESFYGMEFRWNTANTKAMQSLSWPSDDLKAIREQARWAKNMPNVPGYYFLGREMEFAWNRTVMDGKPALESLEQAQLSLQREMNRRQRDFSIADDQDLRVPQMTKPFEWEEPQR
jgi:ABC-type glycerol-3-phosphate transport system substrate-binding protein